MAAGSSMYLITSRTAGDHCQKASAAKPTARSGSAHGRFVQGRPQSAHRSTGPPNSAPSRTALPPIGVSSDERERGAEARRATAPQRSARSARAAAGSGRRARRAGSAGRPRSGTAPSRPRGRPRTGRRGGMNAAAAIARPSERFARSRALGERVGHARPSRGTARPPGCRAGTARRTGSPASSGGAEARAAPPGRTRRRWRTAAGW